MTYQQRGELLTFWESKRDDILASRKYLSIGTRVWSFLLLPATHFYDARCQSLAMLWEQGYWDGEKLSPSPAMIDSICHPSSRESSQS